MLNTIYDTNVRADKTAQDTETDVERPTNDVPIVSGREPEDLQDEGHVIGKAEETRPQDLDILLPQIGPRPVAALCHSSAQLDSRRNKVDQVAFAQTEIENKEFECPSVLPQCASFLPASQVEGNVAKNRMKV